ncbi:hypothetical protein [Erythrobacter donghaensis]|jgi:hypothetical protein|uniref:hypothetical protein n=1 Tax=Erythrobacter donghaensis TaxID=267135 RepID=UPI00093DCB10|nr:hypothetical protein [Erythrobacter donghaensis]
MSEVQKRILAWVAIFLLALATAYALLLASTASAEAMVQPTGKAEEVRLTAAWRYAAFMMSNGAVVSGIFATFMAIVSFAVSRVTEIYTRIYEVAAIVILCLIGIAASTSAMVEVSDAVSNGGMDFYLFNATPFARASELIIGFFGSMIGWFASFMASVLGVSLADKDGVLRKLF